MVPDLRPFPLHHCTCMKYSTGCVIEEGQHLIRCMNMTIRTVCTWTPSHPLTPFPQPIFTEREWSKHSLVPDPSHKNQEAWTGTGFILHARGYRKYQRFLFLVQLQNSTTTTLHTYSVLLHVFSTVIVFTFSYCVIHRAHITQLEIHPGNIYFNVSNYWIGDHRCVKDYLTCHSRKSTSEVNFC